MMQNTRKVGPFILILEALVIDKKLKAKMGVSGIQIAHY